MTKFKLKGVAAEYFEQEIEAPSLEQAQEILSQQYEESELESEFTTGLFFEGEEGYELLEPVIMDKGEDEN